MVLLDCKRCNGTGIYTYHTKSGFRNRTCKICHGNGKVDIVYKEIRHEKTEQV